MEPRPDVQETWYTMRNVTDTERVNRLRVGVRYLGILHNMVSLILHCQTKAF